MSQKPTADGLSSETERKNMLEITCDDKSNEAVVTLKIKGTPLDEIREALMEQETLEGFVRVAIGNKKSDRRWMRAQQQAKCTPKWRNEAQSQGWQVKHEGDDRKFCVRDPEGKLWGWGFSKSLPAWKELHRLNAALYVVPDGPCVNWRQQEEAS